MSENIYEFDESIFDEKEIYRNLVIIEDYVKHIEKCNLEIQKISSTRSYKLGESIKKLNQEIIKGTWKDRYIFVKWVLLKLFNKKNNITFKNQSSFSKIMKYNNRKISNLKEREKKLEVLKYGMKKIDEIIVNSDYKFVDLFVLKCGWNMNLFQRPQHIAINTSKIDGLVLFRGAFDGVDKNMNYPIQKIRNNLYLIDMDNKELFYYLIKKISEISKPKLLHLYSTDNNFSIKEIKKFEKNGFKILYEYIDEISPDISQRKIPVETYDKHYYILKNKNYNVVTTSEKLYQETYNYRGSKNLILSCNGVEYSDWDTSKKQDIPDDLKEILKLNKNIIGYYGAIAPWLDYAIIRKLLTERPEYQIVFIGEIFNSSFNEQDFIEFTNFNFLGAKDYYELKNYAKFFDVCIIPFVKNKITESTSPIKLFEYMALNKPIVTTDLLECRKYDSVIIAKNADDFVSKIDFAIKMKDNQEYINLLDKEAHENTWNSKTKEIFNNQDFEIYDYLGNEGRKK